MWCGISKAVCRWIGMTASEFIQIPRTILTCQRTKMSLNMASQLPMTDWISEVSPGDVMFSQKLQESANSAVFKVAIHGQTCVMKVVSA